MEAKNKEKIVTFSCRPDIYVYNEDSTTLPRQPYRQHKTIEEAKELKPTANIIKVWIKNLYHMKKHQA